MKPFIRPILILLGCIGAGVLIQSCCTQVYRIIDQSELQAYSQDFSLILPEDTVRGEFQLYMLVEGELVQNDFPVPLINNSYATTCEYTYVNPLDVSSLQLRSNKAFLYDGQTIGSDEDFSHLENLEVVIEEIYGVYVQVFFRQNFLDKATFEPGAHTFSLEIQTSDSLLIANEITLNLGL